MLIQRKRRSSIKSTITICFAGNFEVDNIKPEGSTTESTEAGEKTKQKENEEEEEAQKEVDISYQIANDVTERLKLNEEKGSNITKDETEDEPDLEKQLLELYSSTQVT